AFETGGGAALEGDAVPSGRQSATSRSTVRGCAIAAANGAVGDRRSGGLRGGRSGGAQGGPVLFGRDPGRTAPRVPGPEPVPDRGHGRLPEPAEMASVARAAAIGASGGRASAGLAGARHGTAR